MRLHSVRLEWFRGAAEEAILALDGKSFVVYGPNGAGKSSIVDAIEYAIRGGKIEHLAFEYSGKHQEFAIPNISLPNGRKSKISIGLANKSMAQIEIDKAGKITKKDTAELESWDYGRTVLRQEEVSFFIAKQTKGEKYSSLLPLLGLQNLEIAAENVRKLTKAFIQESRLREHEGSLAAATEDVRREFGVKKRPEILEEVTLLYNIYCDGKPPAPLFDLCNKIISVIEKKIAELEADQKLFVALLDISNSKLKEFVEKVRVFESKIVELAQPLATERLEVLNAAKAYSEKLPAEAEVSCPACGQKVAQKDFIEHITAERKKLEALNLAIEEKRSTVAELSGEMRSLKTSVARKDVQKRLVEYEGGKIGAAIDELGKFLLEKLRQSCGAAELNQIEKNIYPIIDAAYECSKNAPKNALELSQHERKIRAAFKLAEADSTKEVIDKINTIVGAFEGLEGSIREEIRLNSKAVMDAISEDIQEMWAILHPGEPIDGVHLYVPGDVDKAIDVALKFYDVEQPSPRLTLSEGYRNSLGLCIFLAMAMRDELVDKPIILDDVVVSFDRGHRGMVVELLKAKFLKRQVVVLTHDRDWYSDLRKLLDPKDWKFGVLLPFENPKVGIRWSAKNSTFEQARQLVKIRPDIGANDARKILDVELAPIAERLQLKFPYLRGEKNDRRMAHEMLGRFASDAPACLKRMKNSKPEPDEATVNQWQETLGLLSSYANRGSHTEDVTAAEAGVLINSCEASLDAFRCEECDTVLGFAKSEKKEWAQCKCSGVRWLYGKA